MPIYFHTESVRFSFNRRNLFKKWIRLLVDKHNKSTGSINIVFTSNEYLLSVNKEYLNHNYNTDVITFDYTEGDLISGDIFISIEQVRINAGSYSTEEDEELRRVMIHGVNHLLGYGDGNEEERLTMRQMENHALHLWLNMV